MRVAKAMETLRNKGYKHTNRREKILRVFVEEERYLSAKDVYERIKHEFPHMSFDTIYRNLSLFTDLSLLKKTALHGEMHFRFNCFTKKVHHHHVICVDCGRTKHIERCPMDQLQDQFADFHITGHKFEVYGKCVQCAV